MHRNVPEPYIQVLLEDISYIKYTQVHFLNPIFFPNNLQNCSTPGAFITENTVCTRIRKMVVVTTLVQLRKRREDFRIQDLHLYRPCEEWTDNKGLLEG